MVRPGFHPATLEDVAGLAVDLRPLDLQELRAESEVAVADILLTALLISEEPVAVHFPDGLAGMFGIAPKTLMSDTAVPWFLGTPLIDKYPREMLTYGREYVLWARERYPKLENWVDARNTPSVKWLKRIGFALDEPAPRGPHGLLFHRFHLGFDDV